MNKNLFRTSLLFTALSLIEGTATAQVTTYANAASGLVEGNFGGWSNSLFPTTGWGEAFLLGSTQELLDWTFYTALAPGGMSGNVVLEIAPWGKTLLAEVSDYPVYISPVTYYSGGAEMTFSNIDTVLAPGLYIAFVAVGTSGAVTWNQLSNPVELVEFYMSASSGGIGEGGYACNAAVTDPALNYCSDGNTSDPGPWDSTLNIYAGNSKALDVQFSADFGPIDSYSGGSLHISSLSIGNAKYSDVVLTIDLPTVSGPSGTSPTTGQDSYNPANHELTVPAVQVGSATYFNALVTVSGLDSIGGVSGADTYDGAYLTIPYVQVGSTTYEQVVLRVSTANLLHVYGGMPSQSVDQYVPGQPNGQLTIPAVLFGSTVYTNVVLGVGPSDIVSVGGIE